MEYLAIALVTAYAVGCAFFVVSMFGDSILLGYQKVKAAYKILYEIPPDDGTSLLVEREGYSYIPYRYQGEHREFVFTTSPYATVSQTLARMYGTRSVGSQIVDITPPPGVTLKFRPCDIGFKVVNVAVDGSNSRSYRNDELVEFPPEEEVTIYD